MRFNELGLNLRVQIGRKMEATPRAPTPQEVVRDVLLCIDASAISAPNTR